MKLYNLYYRAGNKTIEKNKITEIELYNFMKNLKKENDSELRVKQVKNREYEEEER